MKTNSLIIFPKGFFGDKNMNVQLFNSSSEKHNNLKAIVRGIGQYNEYSQYKSLNLFIQGDQKDWTMIESWNDKEDLFFEFVYFLSEKLDLDVDFC